MNVIRNVLLMNLAVGVSFGCWIQSIPAGIAAFLVGGFAIALIDYAKLPANTKP